jgi:hypothetical protein
VTAGLPQGKRYLLASISFPKQCLDETLFYRSDIGAYDFGIGSALTPSPHGDSWLIGMLEFYKVGNLFPAL